MSLLDASFWKSDDWWKDRKVIVGAAVALLCMIILGISLTGVGEDPCDKADRLVHGPVPDPYAGGIEQFDRDVREAIADCEDQLDDEVP